MNDNDIKLPPRPEPDGYLTIKIIGRDVEVNAYRDSTIDAYAREAVRMNASQAALAVVTAERDRLKEALEEARAFIGEQPVRTETVGKSVYLREELGKVMRVMSTIDAAIDAALAQKQENQS